jgi:hypothetical protein
MTHAFTEALSGGAAVAVFVALIAFGGAATAAPDVVILLQPSGASAGQRRCLTRIRQELLSSGFSVTIVDPGPETDPSSLADAVQHQPHSAATIALVGDPTLGVAELWILDRTGIRAAVRRITAPAEDPEHAAEVMAIRTIEVLRASALQRLVDSSEAHTPAPTCPPTLPVVAVVPKDRSASAVELGLAVLDNLGGPGPALIPIARLRAQLSDSFFARVTLEGLGTHPRVHAIEGSAEIDQTFGIVEIGATFRQDRRLEPFVTLGGGALHVAASGEGIYPFTGIDQSRWVASVDLGVGIMAVIRKGWALSFEVHTLIVAPHPVVQFSGIAAGTIGGPALAAAWSVVTWL